jgi:alkanesulfonate monooxygenase SsuD/methylene tetrahydromethanopterin reductase-like flavin-dependent oxidoreductase (luciferase family)
MATALDTRLAVEEARRRTNPLFNDNKLKIGVFGANVSNGCAISTAEGMFETTWANAREVAVIADQAGLEGMVPVARWKGFGGETNFNGTCFETYTWAAGLGEATRQTAVFSTSHVPTVHPILAAKQATTIDHISGGRFALNVVCGWFEPEFQMFGAPIMPHDTRYEYAQEWLDVVKLLWTREDEFDYEGTYFKISKGFHQPKPIQRPFPAIMNAGGSPVGRRFSARNADMAFVAIIDQDYDGAKREVDSIRTMAREDYQRELGVWANAYVVCRDTEKEARDYLHYYVVEKGDDVATDNIARVLGLQAGSIPAPAMERFKFHFKAGWGGYPLVGTPEQITDELRKLSAAGIDGLVMSWPNYQAEMPVFVDRVLPLMEQAGLRRPVQRRDG